MSFRLILFAALTLCGCRKREALPAAVSPCDNEIVSAYLKKVADSDSTKIKIALMEDLLRQMGNCVPGIYKDSLAEAFRNIGHIFWDSFPDEARKHYRRGLAMSPAGVVKGKLYANIGIQYYNENDLFSALPYLDSALFVQPVFPDENYFFNATNFLGGSYLNLGQPHLAEQYLQKALTLAEGMGDNIKIADAYEFITSCKRALRQYEAAIEAGYKGMEALNKIDTPLNIPLANFHTNIANAWQDSLLLCPPRSLRWKQAGDSASWHYLKAKKIYDDEGNKEHRMTLLSNLGEFYRRLGDAGKARGILVEGLQLLGNDPQKSLAESELLGRLYINRGEAFMDAGAYGAAEIDFDSALYYLAPAYTPPTATSKGRIEGPTANPGLVSMAFADKAILEVKKSKGAAEQTYMAALKSALETYDRLVEFTHGARMDYLTDADKITLALHTRPYLDSAFLICLELEKRAKDKSPYRNKAFEYAELSKAMVLLESLQSKQSNASLGGEQLEQKRLLLRERERITNDIFENRASPSRLAGLKEQWLEHLGEWRKFQESIASASRRNAFTASRKVEELQRSVVEDDQALLSYHRIGSVLYVFLLDRSGLQLVAHPLDATFDQDIATVDGILSGHRTHSTFEASEVELYAASRRLYHNLFPDFGKPLPERLIVVPNDDLQALPFEALWDGKAPPTTDYRAFVLFKHAISYAPSANILWEMRKEQGARRGAVAIAAFAPGFPDGLRMGTQNLPQAVEGSIREGILVPLPNDAEAGNISRVVAAKTYLKEDATKRNFWEACRKYKVIHIPTHGVLYQEDPRFNFICFSQTMDSLDPKELLYMHELYDREASLDLDMVVLSACETARGPNVKSEGNMSIARGLAAAGVRSFITTLWQIKAHNTVDLMPLFYKQLASGEAVPKDVALARAKRDYLANSPSNQYPAEWAGIVLIGNSGHIALKKAGNPARYLWALPLIIPVFFLLRRKRNKR